MWTLGGHPLVRDNGEKERIIMNKNITHAINISRVRETILCVGGDVVMEPGDVVLLQDVPELKRMLMRKGATPIPFAEFNAELRRGQWLVFKGPKGLRGYRYGFEEIPAEVLPKKVEPLKEDKVDKKGSK